MPRRKPPEYRSHANGQAFVQHKSIPTKDHRMYLGKYGTDESWDRYWTFIRSLGLGPSAGPAAAGKKPRTLNTLAAAYVVYIESRYSKNGKPTKECVNIQYAVEHLTDKFGDLFAHDLSAGHIEDLQQSLAKEGYARSTINARISKIRRFVKYCVRRREMPAAVLGELQTVESLIPGRFDVKEAPEILPVPRKDADALLPFVAPTVAAMIQVQYLCGMRPQDVTILRRRDIDMTGEIWLYEPHDHKTKWRGKKLVKAIPRAAQEIIQPFLTDDPDAYIFSPRHAHNWHRENRPEKTAPKRKTPIYPSELRRREQEKAEAAANGRRKRLNDRYTAGTYCRAIKYGIARAERHGVKIPHWSPGQLRHTIATEISRLLGQQSAQIFLGHDHMDTTQIYTEHDVQQLIEIAQRLDQIWGRKPRQEP